MLFWLLLPGILLGCQGMPWAGSGAGGMSAGAVTPDYLPRDYELVTLVNYAEWLGQQRSDVLIAAYRAAKQRAEQSRSPADQLPLAMLLSVPDSGFQNNDRALALFEQVLASPEGDGELRSFVRLQQLNLQQRRALNRSWERRLEQQAQQLLTLQQQLEQLKSIEKGLMERQED
ncbi:hypothetical protein [Porticoccus sp.]